MKILSFISLYFLLISHSLAFELPVQSQGPVPALGEPTMIPLELQKQSEDRKMKVLVFPHTLKNDYRHGIPDDPKMVDFNSQSVMSIETKTGLSLKSKTLKLKVVGQEILMELDKGRLAIETSGMTLTSATPIKVDRHLNRDKSHYYKGSIDVLLKKEELKVINTVTIEEYLRGVVPSEAVTTWPLETLKAQAVAARTYALYHYMGYKNEKEGEEKREWHVDDTARFQVYSGLSHVTDATDLAVQETSGKVMTYQGNIIVAYFHSYSGGRTDSALNIFGQTTVPYCLGAPELFTRDELLAELAPRAHWIVNWTTDEFTDNQIIAAFKKNDSRGAFSQFELHKGLDLKVLETNPDFQSVKKLLVTQESEEAEINFTKVRSSLGWSKFPSYHFTMEESENGYQFSGHGWGHHVGMSQWGAFMMAKHHGKTFDEILHHYYSGIELTEL